jgi:hypothetical protein
MIPELWAHFVLCIASVQLGNMQYVYRICGLINYPSYLILDVFGMERTSGERIAIIHSQFLSGLRTINASLHIRSEYIKRSD